MADNIVKGLQFIVEFEEGGVKTLKALRKKIATELGGLEKELQTRLDEGKGTKRVEKRLAELSQAFIEINRKISDYTKENKKAAKEQSDLTKAQKEATKQQRDFNNELKEEQKIRKALRSADLTDVQKNRRQNAQERRPYTLPKNYLKDRALEQELALGKFSTLPPDYLQNRLLELNKGAKTNLPENYFAQDGSINQLKKRLQELRAVKDNIAPGTREFRNLSREIGITETRIGSLLNKFNGDGMASFRKFSHMLFNFTGLFVIASRGFEGLIKTLTRGAEFDTMRQAFQGTTQDIENMRKASRGLLSDEKIFAFSNKATDLGIKIKDQPIFVDMAIRSMKAYGGGVEKLDEILEKVIKSTETAQKELSSLGIKKVDFQKKVQDLSKSLVENNDKYTLVNESLKKSKKDRKNYLLELDAEDQKLVKVNALLSLYGKSLEDVTSVLPTTTDRILGINAQWENFTNTMGQKLIPIATMVFPVITSFFNFLTENSGKIVGALSVITVALASLSAFFFVHANPLSGFVAGIAAIVSLIATYKTAFPDIQAQLDSSNSSLLTNVKDLVGQYSTLFTLIEQSGGVASVRQQELIDQTQTLITQNEDRIRQEEQLNNILSKDRVKELQDENNKIQAQIKLLKDARDKKVPQSPSELIQDIETRKLAGSPNISFRWAELTGDVQMLDKEIGKLSQTYEENRKSIENFQKQSIDKGFISEVSLHYNKMGSSIMGFVTSISNGTASVELLRKALIGMGREGTTALFGISKAALENAKSLGLILQAFGLQVQAADLIKNGDLGSKVIANALNIKASNILEAVKSVFPQKEEQLPGHKVNGKNKKEHHDLQTWDELAKMVQEEFKVKEDIKKTLLEMMELRDAGVKIDNEIFEKLKSEIDTRGITGEEALKKLGGLDISLVQKYKEEKLTTQEREQRVANNIAESYKLQKDFLTGINLEEQIRLKHLEKIADEMKIYSDLLSQVIVKETSHESRIQAINKVADSMRDASLPWNKGIPQMMTFFEMAEIGVHSLAETITSQLGQAWEDMFGEANSLFEMFMKNVTTKILDTLINRGIGLLLSTLFPGIGTILGAGLNPFVGNAAPGTPSLGGNKPNLSGYINRGISNQVNNKLQMGTPYIVEGKIYGKDLKLSLDRYNSLNTKLAG